MKLNPLRFLTVIFALGGLGECVVGIGGWSGNPTHALTTALFLTLMATCTYLLDPRRLGEDPHACDIDLPDFLHHSDTHQ